MSVSGFGWVVGGENQGNEQQRTPRIVEPTEERMELIHQLDESMKLIHRLDESIKNRWEIGDKTLQKCLEIAGGLGFSLVAGIIASATQISTAKSCNENMYGNHCYVSSGLFYSTSAICAIAFSYTIARVFRK